MRGIKGRVSSEKKKLCTLKDIVVLFKISYCVPLALSPAKFLFDMVNIARKSIN